MTNKRLLLLSNSTNYGESFLGYPEGAIKLFLGNTVKTVAFIPFAGVTISWDDYSSRVEERFTQFGYSLRLIHKSANPVDVIRNSDAVMVGGGNSFQLLDQLNNHGLIDIIKSEVEVGKPYIGWSAGSNVASPTIMTTNDMPIVAPSSLAALNLVPFQINPHYTDYKPVGHNGETRAERLEEFIAVNKTVDVVGLFEGTILKIQDDSIEIIGSNPVKLFRHGSDVEDITEGNTLARLVLGAGSR